MTRRVCAAWVLGLALALLVMSAPAAANSLEVASGQPTAAGPTSTRATADSSSAAHEAGYGGVTYQGGRVLHSNRTHLIFWEPSNHPELQFAPGYMPLMERFLRDVARASHSTHDVYGITGQYRDARGPAAYASTYAGAVLDTGPAPVSGCTEPAPPAGPTGWLTCLTDQQLQQELGRVITAEHLPTGHQDIYFLVTPDGFGSCQAAGPDSCALGGSRHGGYCGYHSWLRNGVLYAVIPYNAVPGHCQSSNPRPNGNPADPALSTLSHEQAEAITDPHQDAWYGAGGTEIADLCISSYGPALGGTGSSRWNEKIAGGHFWLQEQYSRITGGCAARPQPDSALILTPAQMAAGRPLRLTAEAHQPGGRIVTYNWNFGDGHGGRGRSPQHTYREAGTYHVYLRVTDSAGNRAYAKRTVTIRPG